jgi:hypothetical protein
MSNDFKEKMMAKLAQQKQDFINAHINTYGEYPSCYMSDLDIDTIFAIRRMLEAKIVKLHDQREKAVRDHVFLKGKQVSLMDFLEHLDEFVERQVSSAEDRIGEPQY